MSKNIATIIKTRVSPIDVWTRKRYPFIVEVLGQKWFDIFISPTKQLLATSPSRKKILDHLDSPSRNKPLRNCLLRSYSTTLDPPFDRPAKNLLKMLEDSLSVLKGIDQGIRFQEIAKELRNGSTFQRRIVPVILAARLAKLCGRVDLDVPNPDSVTRKNFDICIVILNRTLNIEVKTRDDPFPEVGSQVVSRATAEPWFAGASIRVDKTDHDPKPESTPLRRWLRTALPQLPNTGLNCIAFCYIRSHNPTMHLESALYGDPDYRLDKQRGRLVMGRYPNGLFIEQEFNKISAVLQLYLFGTKIHIHPNPNALSPLPKEIQTVLRRLPRLRSSIAKTMPGLKG